MEQQTTTEEPQSPHEIPKKPCIYGEEILGYCPVRFALDNSSDPMAKYKMPSIPALDNVKQMLEMAGETLSSVAGKLQSLVTFCAECPWLSLFYDKKNLESVKAQYKRVDHALKKASRKK